MCCAGCWLPEGVSDPAPRPPQHLLGHWFLSGSLPQIFILFFVFFITSLLDISYYLSQGRCLIHICIVRKELHIGTPVVARRLELQSQRWDWLARCQYAVTRRDSLICHFSLSVAARTSVRADPSLGYTSTLQGR